MRAPSSLSELGAQKMQGRQKTFSTAIPDGGRDKGAKVVRQTWRKELPQGGHVWDS